MGLSLLTGNVLYVNSHDKLLTMREEVWFNSEKVEPLLPGDFCVVNEVMGWLMPNGEFRERAHITRCNNEGQIYQGDCGWVTYRKKGQMFLTRAQLALAMAETEDGQIHEQEM